MKRTVIGWDIGGAHVKAALVQDGRLEAVRQWPCALWQGMHLLDAVIDDAFAAWPEARPAGATGATGATRVRHALTMTGEMVDLFDNRKDGVIRLAVHLGHRLGPSLRLFAGNGEWLAISNATERWPDLASANWAATGRLAARMADRPAGRLNGRPGKAMLIDIGSTTTDLIPLRAAPATASSDAQRLHSGELFYQGVVRTPLCALAGRIEFRGRHYNVMNEFFATTADVYRLTGELDPAHDQHPAADGGSKDPEGSSRRIARMIGHDAADATMADWQRFAHQWRRHQLAILQRELQRVEDAAGVAAEGEEAARVAAEGAPATPPPTLIGAGCGSFLVRALGQDLGRDFIAFHDLVDAPAALHAWADVCAPAVAVALLFDQAGAASS